jgi:hypothetical protein
MLLLASSSNASTALQDNQTLCRGFAPPTELKIPIGTTGSFSFSANETSGGVSEAAYNAVMDRIARLYTDDVKKAGGRLKINRLWKDSSVDATAQRDGSSWIINIYGGMARHKAMTAESLALVTCHEMGHHLGGAPKTPSWDGSLWATNEGGADYFATLKCLRRYFAEDDNTAILAKRKIDPLVKKRCSSEFTSLVNQELCMRISFAARASASFLADLGRERDKTSFATPDLTVVKAMDDDHPATQCRLDTYFNGSTCRVDLSIPISDKDYREGACVQGADALGWRPRCWFFPGK